MLVVKIELWSAITGKVTEVGRMYLGNDGSSLDPSRGNYDVKVARKGTSRWAGLKDFPGWHAVKTVREGRVENYPRKSYNVWRLVLRALRSAFPEEN